MSLQKKAVSGMSWSILIQLANQSFSFFVTIILARILLPKDFGVIGIVIIFVGIGRTILDGGLASSLIRNKDVNQVDYSTVFFTNFFAAILLYFVMFFSSPFVADFFNMPELTMVLRVYAIVFIMGSLTIVQSVRLNKNLDFKTQFKLLIPSLVLSAIVGIWMAKNGYGIWSLVAKEIVFTSLGSIQIWFYSKWTPSLVFDWKIFKYHFSYGINLMMNDLVKRFFNDSYKVLIGKHFSSTQLGLFTRAQSMQELPTSILFNSFNRVAFPLLAQIVGNDEMLKSAYRRMVTSVSFVVVPLLLFLGVLAEPLFMVLLTAKWAQAIPYFQILIISGIFLPLLSYNINICKVKGRSDLVFKFTVFECTLVFLSLFSSIWFGIFGLLWSMVVVNIIKIFVTGYFSGKLIDYNLKEQFLDVLPIYILSLLLGALIYALDSYMFSSIFTDIGRLIIEGIIASVFYLSIAYILKFKALFSLLQIFNKKGKQKSV